jgi:hypothetical protein
MNSSSIRNKARGIVAGILIIAGTPALFFYHEYTGNNVWWWSAVVLMTLGLGLLVIKLHARLANRIGGRSWKEMMRRTAVRTITVDLNRCKVESSSYTYEAPRRSEFSDIQILDQLYDLYTGSSRSVKQVEIIQSSLEYRDPETGETYYSPIIAKDFATLKFKMYDAKQTTIYIAADGNYFFDLDFLDNNRYA